MLLSTIRDSDIKIEFYHYSSLTKLGNPRHPLFMNKKIFKDDSNKNYCELLSK